MRPEDDQSFRHGTKVGYERRKCKCDACREWARERGQRRRERNKARLAAGDPTIRHGSASTYGKFGCRCEACRVAYAESHGTWSDKNRDALRKRAAISRDERRDAVAAGWLPLEAHGTTTGYSYGCRCEPCITARAAYVDAWRAHVTPDEIPHGTRNGFNNYGCRCEACLAANRKYLDALRERRQGETVGSATKRGQAWTGPELEIVATRTDLTLNELAKMLGRTRHGIAAARQRVRDDPKWIQVAGAHARQA